MALLLKKPFCTAHGLTAPQQYWRVANVMVSVRDRSAQFVLESFPDKDTPASAPMAQLSFSLRADDFTAWYTPMVGKGGANLPTAVYKLALSIAAEQKKLDDLATEIAASDHTKARDARHRAESHAQRYGGVTLVGLADAVNV